MVWNVPEVDPVTRIQVQPPDMGGVGVHGGLKQDRGQLMRMCDPMHHHHKPLSSDSVLSSGRHADGFSDQPALGSPGVCFIAPLGPRLVPLWSELNLPFL